MELIVVKPNIYHVKFKDSVEMSSTTLRIFEHEDSPFEKHIFSHEEFEEWFDSNISKGKYKYHEESYSLLLYGTLIKSFINMFNGNLTKDEKDFIDMIKSAIPSKAFERNSKYTIICTYREMLVDYNHELAHALFYLNKEYKKTVKQNIRNIPKEQLKKIIAYVKNDLTYKIELPNVKKFYDDYIEEINARFIEGHQNKISKNINISKSYVDIAKNAFEEYSK